MQHAHAFGPPRPASLETRLLFKPQAPTCASPPPHKRARRRGPADARAVGRPRRRQPDALAAGPGLPGSNADDLGCGPAAATPPTRVPPPVGSKACRHLAGCMRRVRCNQPRRPHPALMLRSSKHRRPPPAYSNPIGTLRHAAARGYAVADFLAVPLPFGTYSSQPEVRRARGAPAAQLTAVCRVCNPTAHVPRAPGNKALPI